MLQLGVKTYVLLVWTFPDSKGFRLWIVRSLLLKYSAKTAKVILDSTDPAQLNQGKESVDPFMLDVFHIPSAVPSIYGIASDFTKNAGKSSASALL